MPSPYAVREHHDFLQASNEALQAANLQLALARLTGTLATGNRTAFAQLEGSDLLREKARHIKDQTLANLDRHLLELEQAVGRRGGHVHWAADAAEAREIIVDICRRRGLTRVVKSKSMATEEVHLNPALFEAGMQVTETDFGEFIIQLAGERPSHLVAPAVHKTREEIARLLSEKLGEPVSSEPHDLAQLARRRLRQHFREAEVGITGGNFVVAETGTVVLISNEGNARLVTTVPPVHIALVGIEKVIPRLADLPVFLKILARAATGQKLSIYTSLCTGPRREGEVDGPEEFHLVLLDNGRTRILGSPLRESLFCIRCGACLNACPVYGKVGGHAYGGVYSGPIGAVLTPLFDGLQANHHLPHASSLCGACQAACPVKIAIPRLLIRLRESLVTERHVPRGERFIYRLWSRAMASPWAYRLLTGSPARGVRWFARDGWLGRLPGSLRGWTDSRDFPAPAPRRFRDLWRDGLSREGIGGDGR
jgi:L-lactate dehydrogenase complex protein LldF